MRGTDERLPRARKEQLLMRELGNERLVYDEKSEEAHCLNLTAALVWDHCDGRTTVSEMAELLAREMRVPASDEIVRFALHQLDKSELLETPWRDLLRLQRCRGAKWSGGSELPQQSPCL